jgi:hypothetical protein
MDVAGRGAGGAAEEDSPLHLVILSSRYFLIDALQFLDPSLLPSRRLSLSHTVHNPMLVGIGF